MVVANSSRAIAMPPRRLISQRYTVGRSHTLQRQFGVTSSDTTLPWIESVFQLARELYPDLLVFWFRPGVSFGQRGETHPFENEFLQLERRIAPLMGIL